MVGSASRAKPMSMPDLTLTVTEHPLRIVLSRQGTPVMVWSSETLAVLHVSGVSARHVLAWDFLRERRLSRRPLRHLISEHQDGADHILELGCLPHQVDVCLRFHWHSSHRLSWHMQAIAPPDSGQIHLAWGFKTRDPHILRGFGQRTRPMTTKAHFDTWVEEGAVGLGPLSPLLRWTGRVPFPKGGYTSPAPLSWWLSNQGYVAWLDTSSMVRFRLSANRLEATIWSASATGQILTFTDPLEGLEQSSAILGRPSLPPPWIFCPWNDSVGGEDHARDLVHLLRDRRIPSSAIWIEDWMGSQQNIRRFWMRPLSHQLDRDLYPSIESFSRECHQLGFRLLGYVCPELTRGTMLYQEALAGQHLVVDQGGLPVDIRILSVSHGELDLSQERTRHFIAQRMLAPLMNLGFDGWMADFGEYLPVDSRLGNGASGWESHNRYPLWWQEVQQNFWRQARPEGDFVYFTRSASLGCQSTTSVMWGGDSDTDWDRGDGLASVIPQLLSAGISGFPYWATDIAGYMSFGLTRPSTRELFIRWMQLGALCPVMRTHHGTARPLNWNFQKDEETLRQYTRYTRLHTALAPYWYALAQEAAERGLPIARPLFLQFPEHAPAWTVSDEFLVGNDLLVAPVIRPGARRRRLWLPPGSWRHWWQGITMSGPGWVEISADLNELPLFIRHGSMLPLFEGRARLEPPDQYQLDGLVDTLAEADGLNDWRELNRSLTLLLTEFTPCAPADLHLGDGTRIRLGHHQAASSPAPQRNAPAPDHHDHLPAGSALGLAVFLAPGQSTRLTVNGQTFGLSIEGGPARWYILRRLGN